MAVNPSYGRLLPDATGWARAALPSPGGDVPPPVLDAEFSSEPPPHHLRDYLRVLAKYRRLAATCFGVTLGITVLFTTLTPRLYTATTRLQVARRAPIQLRLQDNVRRLDDGDEVAAASFLATQIASLQSRDLADRVIRGRRLAEDEAFLHPGSGEIHSILAGKLPSALRPRGWDVARIEGAPPAGDSTSAVDPRLIDRYMRYLVIREVRGTDLIEVGFTTPSPALSAFLAAAHAQAFMEANEEAQRATDGVAKDFLGRQLREARKEIGRAEAALNRFATAHPEIAANQEQKLAATRIGQLSSLVTEVEATRTTLESRYEFLTRPDARPLSYFLDRPSIQKLRATLADVRTQQAGLGQRLGPNHPRMTELAQLGAEVDQQIRDEVAEGVAAARADYDAARLREERLRRKLAQQQELGIDMRGLGARYDVLKNYLDSAQGLHASLLKQRTETAVSSELVASNLRVIERAEIPHRPSTPKIPLNLTIGTAAGLLLAFAAAFTRDYFDDTVKSSEEVQDLLHLPTLATIPNFAIAHQADVRALGSNLPVPARTGYAGVLYRVQSERRGREELMVAREPRSMVAEAFRSMRTAVLFSTQGAPPTVILVTSGRAAEGKTVASVNLASTLAEAGSHVLLIDADLRYPRCHTVLGVTNERGLSSVLAGEEKLESAIRVLESPRLCFLPAGPPPPNPAEALGSAGMRLVLAELRSRFDFVVIDTSPVLPVTDAVVLAREADGVVLVVKGHDTPRELVRLARDRLMRAGASFLGVIVNNVDLGWGDPYFYSYAGYSGRGARPGREERSPAI
jgi:succinoglycan biosynthesis transport protein ExoP